MYNPYDETPFGIKIIGTVIFIGLILIICKAISWIQLGGSVEKTLKPVCQSVIDDKPIFNSKQFGKVWLYEFPTMNMIVLDLKPESFNLISAKKLNDINTVICLNRLDNVIETCTYEGIDKPWQRVTLTKKQHKWHIVVVDWETKRVRGEKTFFGGVPKRGCEEQMEFYGNTGSADQYGSVPSNSEIIEWLTSIESGKTNDNE